MTRSVLSAAAPIILAALTALSGPAFSQTAAETVASTCSACHGETGISGSPVIPNLAGQKAGYIEAQLKAFKAKSRTNAFMNPIAGQLSDDQIHLLALYWAALPAAPAGGAQVATIASSATLPAGFPAGFTRYQDKPADGGGRIQRYANAAALIAAKAGQPLPDGAAIVSVGLDKAGAVTAYETLESRAGWGAALPPLLRNGDVQYGRFDKTGKPMANFSQAACLACHKAKAADSYMFTHDVLAGAKG
jgi:cytochrome c553